MSDQGSNPIPDDKFAWLVQHSNDAYAKALAFQKEYDEGRSKLPPSLQKPAQRLSLRVARYQYRIQIRWHYRSQSGKVHRLLRLMCSVNSQGKPYLVLNNETCSLHVKGDDAQIGWLLDLENRVWGLINHAEHLGEICLERKISVASPSKSK